MTHCEIRFTHEHFEINDDKCVSLLKAFLKKQKFEIRDYIYGIERIDKWGEKTKAHIHFKFESGYDIKKNTLQKNFREFMRAYGFPVSGVKHYAIMIESQPDDEDRWWRYVLKEEDALIGCNEGMKKFVEENMALAQDERKRQIQKNREARDRFLDKDSFKGKMFQYFTAELTITTEREFYIELIKYFQAKSKVPPFSKIKDYWRDYQIQTGLMTPEYYVDAFVLENKKI